MTSKYLARATPRAYEGVKELVGLWGIKAKEAGGRSWAVEEDMQGATMVSPFSSPFAIYRSRLISRTLFVSLVYLTQCKVWVSD
jgi:hypothetical protein